jgi:hypothetical protein
VRRAQWRGDEVDDAWASGGIRPDDPLRRRRRGGCAVAVLVAVVAGAALVVAARTVGFGHRHAAGPPCAATSGTSAFSFDLDQAENATTIAAIGKRLGLADHAVTIALAAALQESRLRNLPYGDLDSLGLFQQRPSQGWGTPAQIQTPSYAAGAFFAHLARVPGWQDMAVADAAQAVQHSAAPAAYAQWEAQARVMAEALTGELPAAFSCRVRVGGTTPADTVAMARALDGEAGPVDLAAPLPAPRGWTVASWIIGHARQFSVSSVRFGGSRWTASGGVWTADPSAGAVIVVDATGRA